MSLPPPLDLIKSDFHLRGFLKEKVWGGGTPTHTHARMHAHLSLEKLKQNIQLCTSSITKKLFSTVHHNTREMANACTAECEQHIST